MRLYDVLHRIFGEYIFKTDVKSFSRFSGLMAQKHFNFWGSKVDDGWVVFHASVFNAEAISELARESSVPLEMCSCKGLPFVFSRYRARYGMFVGLVIALFLMLYSQLFVWKITVSGNVDMTKGEVLSALSDCGIAVGSYIPDIDVSGDANLVLMSCRDLSSVAISINGTHLNVSVLERKHIPEIIDESGFYNVIAERDGVILDIDAAEGAPEVREGDAVFKGELLINSFIEGTNGSYRPTHARGIVYAAVKDSFVSEIPLARPTKIYTGNTESICIYNILGWEVPTFSGGESSYEYFDAITSERIIKLFGFIELPIKELRITYSEYVIETVEIDAHTAELIANESLADHFAELDLEVLDCTTEFYEDKEKGICVLKADAVLKQNIAKEVPFELINYKISERFPIARE